MKNIWLISDTHFNHAKLEEWGGRPVDFQFDFYKGLQQIPEGDILIHLGDICIGEDHQVHWDLFGSDPMVAKGVKKILIRGNHDKKSIQWYLEHGWDVVMDGMDLIYHGHYLHLTHRPSRPQGNSTFNIHGHTHGNMHRSEEYLDFYSKDYHIDISPELMGYMPLRLDTLLKGRR